MVGGIAGVISCIFFLPFGKWYMLVPSVFFLGFAIIPLIPTMTEWCCETSYPIGESTVTGFLWAIAHIYAGTTGIAYTALLEKSTKGSVILILSIVTVLFCVATGLLFLIKRAPLKRLQAEKDKE